MYGKHLKNFDCIGYKIQAFKVKKPYFLFLESLDYKALDPLNLNFCTIVCEFKLVYIEEYIDFRIWEKDSKIPFVLFILKRIIKSNQI